MEVGEVCQLLNSNYKRKTDQKPLTQALYDQACSLMKEGVSLRQAAKAIGFSHIALMTRMRLGKGGSKLGRFRKIFTLAQEDDLVRHCVELDKRFFGLSLKSLRYLLYAYAKKNSISCPFSDESKMAGRDFTRAFMKRNKLSLRTARKTSVARTMGFNRHQLKLYFDNLEDTLKKYNFGPECIYNMDESGVQTVPNKIPKHIAPTGKKEVAKSTSAEQGKTITVVCAMSAVGQFVPPFFIYGRKRENRLLIKGGPIGCDMALTDKGYMNSATFVKWLDHFKKYTNPTPENPILLILDNHISHISLIAVEFAKSNYIHLLTLPPHSSHKTQPLDRCFFRPFKAFYDAAADSWTNSNPGQTISEFEVSELVKIAFERAATVETAVQGFHSTGIYPFDKNKFTDVDFLPSEVTDQEPEVTEPQDDEEQRFIYFNHDCNDHPPRGDDLPPESQLPDEPTSMMDDISPGQLIGEASSTGNSAHIAQEVAHSVHYPERPSFSGDWVPAVASPEDIIPLPKIKIKRKRTGRGLKSVLPTSAPNKKYLEEKEQEKAKREKSSKLLKKNKKPRKALFPPLKHKLQRTKKPSPPSYTSSDSDSYSVHNSSLDLDGLFSETENEEDDEPSENSQSTRKLQVNDFAVVKVQGKTKDSVRLYVSKIVHVFDDGYYALFYRRIPQTQRFTETKEEAFLKPQDIYMTLSKPIKCTSGRFINTVTFSSDFNDLTIY